MLGHHHRQSIAFVTACAAPGGCRCPDYRQARSVDQAQASSFKHAARPKAFYLERRMFRRKRPSLGMWNRSTRISRTCNTVAWRLVQKPPLHLRRSIKTHLFLFASMLTLVRRSCTVQGHPAVPSLLSDVIVSPYGDSNGEMDAAIASRSLLKLKARHLFMIQVWGRFHAAILPGYESPALHCPRRSLGSSMHSHLAHPSRHSSSFSPSRFPAH
jgi:hypothetical protein